MKIYLTEIPVLLCNTTLFNQLLIKDSLLIASFFLLSLIFLYIYQQRLKKQAELVGIRLSKIEGELLLERKLKNAEIKALKSQMNPHFLFNTFNSIQEFIMVNNKELASDYLGKFADLMRLYLSHSSKKIISLEDEIRAIELYLDLEKMRFEDKLSYTIHLAENTRASNINLPPMLIQPFIEHSLGHSLLGKKDSRQLDIGFEIDGDVLVCIVEDNGIERKQPARLNEKKNKGFVSLEIQNRIELLNARRERAITIEIIDLENESKETLGTKVMIRIPNEDL